MFEPDDPSDYEDRPEIFDLRLSPNPPYWFATWENFFNAIRAKIKHLDTKRVIMNGSGEVKIYPKYGSNVDTLIFYFPETYQYLRKLIWAAAANKKIPDTQEFAAVHWHSCQRYRRSGKIQQRPSFIVVPRAQPQVSRVHPDRQPSIVAIDPTEVKRSRVEPQFQVSPHQPEAPSSPPLLQQEPLFSPRELSQAQVLPAPRPSSLYEEEVLEDDPDDIPDDDDDDDEEEEEGEAATREVPHPENNQGNPDPQSSADMQQGEEEVWYHQFSWLDADSAALIESFVREAFTVVFGESVFEEIMKKAGYTWTNEEEKRESYLNWCRDLTTFATLILEQHDADGYLYPSLSQLIEFLRAAPFGVGLAFGLRKGYNMDEIIGMTQFVPGSGFFTYMYIWWIFFTSCQPGFEALSDVLRFNLRWDKQQDPVTHRPASAQSSVSVSVEGFFQFTNLEQRARALRSYFGNIHREIQKAWGATSEYWYHGGGNDKYAKDWDHISGVVGGFWHKDMTVDRTAIMGNNKFWTCYFGDPGNSWFSATMQSTLTKFQQDHVTMIPDEWRHNCFRKALNCVCPRGQLLCSCGAGEGYGAVTIDEIQREYADSNILVIQVKIFARSENKPRELSLVVLGDNYFTSPDSRVILINNPCYHGGSAHCCLLRPLPEPEDETEEDRIKRLSFYNKFLHIIAKNKQCFCPICGLLYEEKDEKVHMKRHSGKIYCDFCGITCESEEALKIHDQFHCRHLGMGCTYEFADEIKHYQEKTEKAQRIIYADLESAITENGTHVTILCGWTDSSDYKVHISRQISDLLNYAGKLEAEEVIIYFHNGEGYDFHFVLLEIGKIAYEMMKEINITADSSEKIRYFDIRYKPRGQEVFRKICFRDSFAFVSQSLSKWLESTKKCEHDFKCFDATFTDPRQRELVLQKNPFPYNAIKSAKDLDESIDKMGEWFTAENNTELFCDRYSKQELEEIFRTWFIPALDTFKWRSVEDYYRTYLTCDVAQLCDVMEHFAKGVNEEFGLNVHYYFGTPSLTWAAWLKHIDGKFVLDALPEEGFDIVMSSIRGGQTGAMTRLYDSETVEDDKETICYDLDCNSLYATVMLKMKYPCHDWKITTEIPSDHHFLMVWLKELHEAGRSGFIELSFDVKDDPNLYSYMPVASRRRIHGIYDYKAMREYGEKGETPARQIFSGLCNVVGLHEHYCCHTKLLLFYLEHEFIEVRAVHKCLHGKDEAVFEEYVKHNLDKRAEFAGDAIKKMLYKLMNNSLYGKTYEDVTKRQSFAVEQTAKYAQLREDEKKREILKMDKWVIYETYQRSFLMDKPIYLGAAITEFSKLWMYRFFYSQIRPVYPSAQVLYTDTDALTIKFPRGVTSLQQVAQALLLRFGEQIIDTSNWENPSIMGEGTYELNNQPGLFKSETDDHRIVKMIALRAKTYIMVCDDGSVKMSVKGCPMKEKSKLTFQDFRQILFGNGETKTIEYDAIQSKYHIVKSTTLTRVVLSADDLKRYIHDDRIHTSPLFSIDHIRNTL